jgi:signal transduction histidine kinase
MKKLTLGLISSLALLAGVASVQAAEFGSAAEAKAMLEKAVAAVKADKAKALAAFNAGTDGFKDRDLYPFCANAADGIFTAHPKLAGKSLKDLKDKEGKALGEAILSSAKEGTVAEVDYKWPRPGTEQPVQKVSFATKVGDQVCAVGYYK